MSEVLPFSYDAVPYESRAFPLTHPDHLAAVALLRGLHPPAVERCRVLELGCASGGNLLPMALTLPESTFVGIDLSARQVADGQKIIDALGLKNVALRHMNLMEIDDAFGQFDYVIAYGVYSWVPPAVQDKVLEICKRNLTPAGVAYVNYNTYPGWGMTRMIRELLVYHTRAAREPGERLRQARELLDFLAQPAGPAPDTPYRAHLQAEVELLRRYEDPFFFHDLLEDCNEPIYFHQFVERSATKGLQYLGEAELHAMLPGLCPPVLSAPLQRLSADPIHKEQYLDMWQRRSLRQTLLCHAQQAPQPAPWPEQMSVFHLAAPVRPVSARPDFHSNAVEEFLGVGGVSLSIRDPLTKTAFVVLAEIWPESMPFQALLAEIRMRLVEGNPQTARLLDRDPQLLGQRLLHCYLSASTSVLCLHVSPPRCTNKIGACPTASPLARLQAARGSWVANLRHESVRLDDLERHVLLRLDGSQERATILESLVGLAAAGQLQLEQQGRASAKASDLRTYLAPELERLLAQLVRKALLVE